MTLSRRLSSLAVAVSLVALAGCGSSAKSSTAGTVAGDFQGAGAAPATTAAAAATTAAATAGKAPSGLSDTEALSIAAGGSAAPAPERKIATVSTVDIQAREVGDATAKVLAFIDGVGGYVAAQQTSLGDAPISTITAKIPPSELGHLLNSIGGVGKVIARGQQADDVTAQYVDLEGRITSQRISVDRMRELYAKAATVEELAKAEAELARRESDLEQMLGQKRVLNSRVDLATLTISIHPEPPVVPTTTTTTTTVAPPLTPGRALTKSTNALGKFLSGLFLVVILLAPWLLVAAVVLTPIVLLTRRQSRIRADQGAKALAEARTAHVQPFPTMPTAPAAPVHPATASATPAQEPVSSGV